jgi:hypothetical protein
VTGLLRFGNTELVSIDRANVKIGINRSEKFLSLLSVVSLPLDSTKLSKIHRLFSQSCDCICIDIFGENVHVGEYAIRKTLIEDPLKKLSGHFKLQPVFKRRILVVQRETTTLLSKLLK